MVGKGQPPKAPEDKKQIFTIYVSSNQKETIETWKNALEITQWIRQETMARYR